jgi:hypothetical protein
MIFYVQMENEINPIKHLQNVALAEIRCHHSVEVSHLTLLYVILHVLQNILNKNRIYLLIL